MILFTIKQAAMKLQLSPSKVYELCVCGKLTHYRLDGAIRISEEQLQAYLKEREQSGSVHPPAPVPLRHITL